MPTIRKRAYAGEGAGPDSSPRLVERRPEVESYLLGDAGLLPRQAIQYLINRKIIRASVEIEESQIQPASLDLRLGARAYRVQASFLPGRERTVAEQLKDLVYDELDLTESAVLAKGGVYVVELLEFLNLPDSVSAIANPKSSTGRVDVFTRLISDKGEVFDSLPGGYRGPLYAEISPRSFNIRVRKGSRLNQIRFRKRNSNQQDYVAQKVSDKELRDRNSTKPLVDGTANFRNGLVLRVDLSGDPGVRRVGYRAQHITQVIDVDRVGEYEVQEYWDILYARADRRLILDPHQFYILASQEQIHIPVDLGAEMVPIDPTMGEFRVHYAGFFDPGFGWTDHGHPGSRAVLEVRSHEVPFVLEDGQIIGRLEYEKITQEPSQMYGQGSTSNYQGQGLKLSKHFRPV